MTESGVLLIAAAAVIAVCAAPVLYVLWRDRTRIWSLEQRLLRLEAGQESVARLDRVARLEGRFERALRLDDASERLARLEAVSERFPSVEDRVSPCSRCIGVLRRGRSARAGPVERAGRSRAGWRQEEEVR